MRETGHRRSLAQPASPFGADSNINQDVTAAVAIDATGRAVDAWMVRPGFGRVNEVTIDAALASSYNPARIYCAPLPGIFLSGASFRS